MIEAFLIEATPFGRKSLTGVRLAKRPPKEGVNFVPVRVSSLPRARVELGSYQSPADPDLYLLGLEEARARINVEPLGMLWTLFAGLAVAFIAIGYAATLDWLWR